MEGERVSGKKLVWNVMFELS